MATNQKAVSGKNHPSATLYDQPAGTIAHKARYGASEVSKQPNENGDLPNKPGTEGDVRT